MADETPHAELGTWMTAKQAAAYLGVSVDTVRRRLQRGELEGRRETIPQGFRYLVRVDPAKIEAVESSLSDRTENRGVEVSPHQHDIVVALQRELELRNQEIVSLHATLATLARALEHAEARSASVSGREADHDAGAIVDPSAHPGGIWRALRRFWRG
jgi:excisionase family DNA binding protein